MTNLCLKPGTWVFLHISTTVISETCKSLLTLINIQNFCFCFISLFYANTCWKIAILTKLRLPSSIVNISMLQEIPDPLHRPLSEMEFDNVKVLLPACGTWKRGEDWKRLRLIILMGNHKVRMYFPYFLLFKWFHKKFVSLKGMGNLSAVLVTGGTSFDQGNWRNFNSSEEGRAGRSSGTLHEWKK